MTTGLEYGNNVYGGGAIPEYASNNATWGAPASQLQSHGGYTMVSVSHRMSKDHLLILPFYEDERSLQRRRTSGSQLHCV